MEELDTPDYIYRPAIRIEQPLGTFFAFSLDAETLNRLTYSQPAEVREKLEQETDERGGYSIFGTQRGESKKRLDEIAAFIQTAEATFPNAIILAANYDKTGGYINSERNRWIATEHNNSSYSLRIPTLQATASIIDGQHRLHAFSRLPEDSPQRKMELLCVVFLELPTPFHAYIFATINFNQKKVDRSLAYELFGFDVDERPPLFWPPETLAVYLSRLLNTDEKSPLYRSIFPVADLEKLFAQSESVNDLKIRVSMATVVDGILRLISKNPKEDRYTIRKTLNHNKGRKALTSVATLPLREYYLNENDKAIYDLLSNYFHAVKETVWKGTTADSYLLKTVGIQALFDVLRVLMRVYPISSKNYSIDALTRRLRPCTGIDPQGTKYQASGIGRSEIRQDLLSALDLEQGERLDVLTCTVKGAIAYGVKVPNGFMVFQGSTAALDERPSAATQGPWVVTLRNRLIDEGVLVQEGEYLRFSDNVEFASPSAAAAVIYGGTAPGPLAWKDASGKALKELME